MMKIIVRPVVAVIVTIFALSTIFGVEESTNVEQLSVRDVYVSQPEVLPTQSFNQEIESPLPAEAESTQEPQVLQPEGKIKTADDVATLPDETVFRTMATQAGATWGLDSIDGVRDGSYTYVSDGSGIRIYIVDTGVDALHPEFGGRVVDGFDAFGQNLDQTDCNGHGTHVAGIAAGRYFGVAKSATIVPVRVMDCNGVGNTTTLTQGIDWILRTHSDGLGVVNMSIGGSKDSTVDAITERLVDAGLVVVAAAGNSGSDACQFSPASARGVIAVAAINRDGSRASFSNYGSCVDISAPGSQINSANSADYGVSRRMSGTSQASPFVAGAIATYALASREASESLLYEISQGGVVRVQSEPEASVEPSPEPIVEPEPEPIEPEPSPSPVVDEPIVPEVTVTQNSVGSLFGKVKWTAVDGASEYRIYKTGSIRPSWRLFWTGSPESTHRNVSDAIGAIAIYRVVAMVDGREVLVGEARYQPVG